GDGTTSGQTNPQKPYITYGEYTISLTAVNEEGCSASKSNLLKVHATPAVDYSIEQACAGLSTMLKDQSFVADGSVAQVDWSINGAAPLSGFSLEKTYDYPGTYQLKQTVKSAFGCSNSKESLFEIHEALKADFSFYPNAFIVGETTVFVNETQGGSAVQWTFGGFATAQQDTSLVFTEEQIGEEITVQLWVENENGCVDSVSVTREVVSRETDLLISEIFTQEVDGFLTIGVRLKNEGATPIENVELTLQKSGNILLKEIWTGELQANEEEVYVFSAALSSFIAMEDSLSQYICIRGRIINSSFQETDLSNNEFCRTLNTSQSIIIQPYPNPVRTQLTIRLLMPFEENGSLMMYDNYGRLVKNVFENKKLEVGLNSIEVDVSQIASGKYSIVYRGERQVQIANVVVAN
ncbi:MAG TPA: T9SS type A sorting domain-containing protein, partial [Brumimicrobium sp.]|nr:T9SS type A sorting domain-containing protein [Brumimicrobium sp.]